jgi:hypothetical protein
MESDVDLYLTNLSNDSARWRRFGRPGGEFFIDSLLDGLTGVGAISHEEAETRRVQLLATSNTYSARFRSADGVVKADQTRAPAAFSQFIELVPARQAAREIPNLGSFQILGIERYDNKGAIIWRMVPPRVQESPDDAVGVASFDAGPEIRSFELSDDAGTRYQMTFGSSGGRVERVGRYEFRPAPPNDATILNVRFEDLIFEINVSSQPH